MLARLAAEPTRVFGKWELLRDVWGYRSLAADLLASFARSFARPRLALTGPEPYARRPA